MAKKKKKSNTPRAKRMNRKSRLQSASDSWLKTYTGACFIRGYRKHFGVNATTAVLELRMLDVSLTDHVVRKALEGEQASIQAKQARKEQRLQRLRELQDEGDYWSDETFAYIAGYTSGGMAYGITWEEQDRDEREAPFDWEAFMRYHEREPQSQERMLDRNAEKTTTFEAVDCPFR